MGAVAGTSLGPASFAHVEELLTGIFDDVGAILTSFSGGPDDPNGPVTNGTTLSKDAARLDAASHKAQDLVVELNRIKGEAGRDGR